MLCAANTAVLAQGNGPAAGPGFASRQFETRAQLESQARLAESKKRTGEAFLLRARLTNGDFQEGDRIVVHLESREILRDTLQVRTGKVLQFPRMGDLSLAGVLRSELTDTVQYHLAKYLNNPVVRATPLVPIAILGAVVQPGYYYAGADVVLRDVIMKAGGPRGDAALDKVVIRRGGEVIWNAADVQVALSDGLSLDGLHLRAGDELFVPEKKRFQFNSVMTVVSASFALILGIVQLTR